MSINHRSRIQSHLSPLDLPGGENFPERNSNGAAAPVSDETVVAKGAREQNTSALNHDLAELVWKFFAEELREILIEVQEVIGAEHSRSTGHSQRKQK